MKYAQDDLLTWPYYKRQLIVVESDEAVAAVRRAQVAGQGNRRFEFVGGAASRIENSGRAGKRLAPESGGQAFGLVAGVAVEVVAATAIYLLKAQKKAERIDLPFVSVTSSQANRLNFPNGHPREKVLYVGDPGVAGNYYPVANFHRIMFEGKVAELIRLLECLGATEIKIDYQEGFERGANVDLSVPSVGGAKGSASSTKKKRSDGKFNLRLSPTAPAEIPQDLIWYRSEPLWQAVANARMRSGLRDFGLELTYTEDFGVNATLKAKVASVGLQLGGRFTDYRETKWKISGTFAEQ